MTVYIVFIYDEDYFEHQLDSVWADFNKAQGYALRYGGYVVSRAVI